MPSFKFTLEDGRTGRVEGATKEEALANYTRFVMPDMLRRASDQEEESPPPPVPMKPRGPTKEKLAADLEADRKRYDPAKDMGPLSKLGVGFQSGLRNTITGVKDLVGLADDEDIQERKDREVRNKPLGNWGKVGTFAGEAAATAVPAGGAAAGTAKVLTKAIPYLAKVGGYGGKVLNAGAVGRGAVGGAVDTALTGEADDGGDLNARFNSAVEGAEGGAAAPVVLKAALAPFKTAGKVGSKLYNAFRPTEKELQNRAVESLEKTMGREGLDDARRAMEHAGVPTVPQSSAAMANSPQLAALERGARTRGNADFNSHDENVARAAWEHLQPTPGHSSQAGDVLRMKFMRNGQPQTARVFGEGPDMVPELESRPLRRMLGKLSQHMDPDEVDRASAIASDLGKHELVRQASGAVTPEVKKLSDYLPSVAAVAVDLKVTGGLGTLTRLALRSARRTVMNSVRSGKEGKITKEIDEALLDPDKFMSMVDTVRARAAGNEPLSESDKIFMRIAEEANDQISRMAASSTQTK